MAAKQRQQDQIAAIKARVSGLSAPAPNTAMPAHSDSAGTADRQEQARDHFLGRIERFVADRVVERLPIGYIAPDLRPEMRQPRMVPLPEELAGVVVPPIYQELVAELRALGASIAERQLQPIVVYPGTSERYPAARYLILIGQRRWTAAYLVGLQEIDAVVIDPPSTLDRVRLQYRENDDREDFSDMERAWTLQQLRRAMGGDAVPVPEVASYLNIKRSRAYQLLRMLVFTPEQQRLIALLRLQERQLLSLIDALHEGRLKEGEVTAVLQRLGEIAAERALETSALAVTDTTRNSESPRRSGIDAPTVARLVARQVTRETAAERVPLPRWYPSLRQDVASTARSIHRALDRSEALGPAEVAALHANLLSLQTQVQALLARLDLHVADDKVTR